MNIITALFAGLLFFLLSPNILLRLPKNGNKITVAGVHAVVFAFVLYFFNSFFHRLVGGIVTLNKCSTCGTVLHGKEGFLDDKCTDGTNEDEGPYHLENENDQTSCKPKM